MRPPSFLGAITAGILEGLGNVHDCAASQAWLAGFLAGSRAGSETALVRARTPSSPRPHKVYFNSARRRDRCGLCTTTPEPLHAGFRRPGSYSRRCIS